MIIDILIISMQFAVVWNSSQLCKEKKRVQIKYTLVGIDHFIILIKDICNKTFLGGFKAQDVVAALIGAHCMLKTIINLFIEKQWFSGS